MPILSRLGQVLGCHEVASFCAIVQPRMTIWVGPISTGRLAGHFLAFGQNMLRWRIRGGIIRISTDELISKECNFQEASARNSTRHSRLLWRQRGLQHILQIHPVTSKFALPGAGTLVSMTVTWNLLYEKIVMSEAGGSHVITCETVLHVTF
jgi:hypothetical protein